MNRNIINTLVLSLSLVSGPGLCATLVTNATIKSVRSAWFYAPFIQVTLAAAQGPCASTTITYAEASQGITSEEEASLMNRHLGILLAAKLAGKKVSIYGGSCSDARDTTIQ